MKARTLALVAALVAALITVEAHALSGGTNISISNGVISITGQVGVANGGTGRSTLTDRGLLVGRGTAAVDSVSPGTAGQVCQSAGPSANPVMAALDLSLSATVGSSILGVANGGTGRATLTSGNLMLGAGTSQVTFLAPTDDNVTVGNGTTFQLKAVPDCDDTGGNHLNYDTGTNAFSCGTSGGGTTLAAPMNVSTLGTITQGTTLHLGPGNVDASQGRAQTIAAETMTLDQMRCVASVAPGGSDTFTVTMADGACTGALTDSTNQTVTITGSSRTSTQATTGEAITGGECWAVKVVASAGAAEAIVSCSFERNA